VIRDLVAAATGPQSERGDQLIVESLPFEATLSRRTAGLMPPSAKVARPRRSTWLDQLCAEDPPCDRRGGRGGSLLP